MLGFLIICAFLKCAIAKVGFEKNKISQGFEALARAQCLLRSKVSLGKMTLLSQVSLVLVLLSYINSLFCEGYKLCLFFISFVILHVSGVV